MRRLLLLGLWLVTGAVAAQHPVRTADKDRYGFFLAGGRNVTRIPFQLHSNLIIIPVQVNGSDTLRFILDTGVSTVILTDPHALTKGALQLTRKVKIAGAGEGDVLTATVAIDNFLSVAHLRATHQNIVVLDSDILRLSEYVGTPIHGIFGYEIFNNFVVEIDFQAREITLTRPDKYRYRRSKGDKYPLDIQDTKPYTDITAMLDDGHTMPLRVVLDTGAGHALLLDRSRHPEAIPLPQKVIRAQLGRGLSGVINGSLGRIQKLSFGKHEVIDVLTSFPDSMAFGMKLLNASERQGNVGCELLRRFRVTFNYSEKYMLLKPVKRLLRESFEHDMSGLELRAKGVGFRTYIVDKIVQNSPADQAGLSEGDELVYINNSPTSTLTISDIYKILQKGEGKEVSVFIRRSGQMLFTHFALKRLI
jgi:predicted aspartyl protease